MTDTVVKSYGVECIRIVTRDEFKDGGYVVQIDEGGWTDASLPVLDLCTAEAIADAYRKDGYGDD